MHAFLCLYVFHVLFHRVSSFCLFVLFYSDFFSYVLLYFIRLLFPRMPVGFPMEDSKCVGLGGREGGEELEGVDGREPIIRIYCI